MAASTNYADASYLSEDVQKKVIGAFVLKLSVRPSVHLSIRLSLSFIYLFFLDDADAGEIKKSHKSFRRRQNDANKNEKEAGLSKQRWLDQRRSVSSHSSGEEVLLLL